MKKKYIVLTIALTAVFTVGIIYGARWFSENIVGENKLSYISENYNMKYYYEPGFTYTAELTNEEKAELADILHQVKTFEKVNIFEDGATSYIETCSFIFEFCETGNSPTEKITRFAICNEELCFVNEISYRMKLPEEYYERYKKLISQLDDRTLSLRKEAEKTREVNGK